MEETHTIPITTPDESAAQQPSGNDSRLAQFLTQMQAYFVSNVAASVIVVWSVFLFVGGVFFLVYFALIGFMPEIDVKTSVALLAVSALTGGILLVLTGISLLGPSWRWVQMTQHQEPLKSPWWFGLPMVVALISFILIGLLKPKWVEWYWAVPLSIALITSGLLFYPELLEKLHRVYTSGDIWRPYRIKVSPKELIHGLKRLGKQRFRQRWKSVMAFNVGFLISVYLFVPLFLIPLALIKATPDTHKYAMLYFSISVAVIWIVNFVVVKSFSTPRYLALAATTLFYILCTLNAWAFFPKLMVSIYKFGNLPNASLVLDETGCTIVQHHGLIPTPHTPNPSTHTPSNPKTCSLSSVMIHSRLGNTYYLETSHSNGTSVVQFTIPGQNVLSWASQKR